MVLDYDKLLEELVSAGMQRKRAKEMVKQFKQDVANCSQNYEDVALRDWSLNRGFLPGRAQLYGSAFNDETCGDYYSDFDYFMAHPINNHFAIWINDKLTLKYMLNTQGLGHVMPEYYLYIENDGRYSYLMDAPESVAKGPNFLFDLLLEKKRLAMKPNNGAGGAGFVGLEYRDDVVFMNGVASSREELEALKPSLNGYIVTEYVVQSSQMSAVFDGAAAALRVVMYKKVQAAPEDSADYGCLMAYARFGTNKSEGASNMSKGGLCAAFDFETGCFRGAFRGRPVFWGDEGIRGMDVHPDTGVSLDGCAVPHWGAIREGMLQVCNYLSSLDYLGIDVIVTEDGFKICEINSAPSVGYGQFSYGKCVLDNEDARAFAQSKRRPSAKTLRECFEAALIEH